MTLRRKIGYSVGAIVLAIALAAAWMLGPALLPPKQVEAGIAMGAKAPVDLELRNAKGASATLSASMGAKGMVLFLVRSADWCPFCKAQLIRTQEIAGDIGKAGYGLASVSYDEPAVLERFAAEKGVAFNLLSDKGSTLIDALGLRDPQYPAGHMAYGVPRASILILAPDGSVKAKYIADDYRSRPSNEVVLEMIAGAS